MVILNNISMDDQASSNFKNRNEETESKSKQIGSNIGRENRLLLERAARLELMISQTFKQRRQARRRYLKVIKKVQRKSLITTRTVDLAVLRCGLDTLKPGMSLEEKKRVAKRTADLEELFSPCIPEEAEAQMAAASKEKFLEEREILYEMGGDHHSFDPAQVQPDLNE